MPCRYDPNQQQFILDYFEVRNPEMPLEVLEEEVNKSKMQIVVTNEAFSRALCRLKAESKDRAVACVNLSDCHDWEDVGKALEKMTAEYKDDKSAWAKVRKVFRNVGDHSKSIQSFVHLLPDGQYKTLAGGLTLILTVSTLYRQNHLS